MVSDAAEKEALIKACDGRKIECSDRNACDVELLCVGGFSPLDGFMNEARAMPVLVLLLPCQTELRLIKRLWS